MQRSSDEEWLKRTTLDRRAFHLSKHLQLQISLPFLEHTNFSCDSQIDVRSWPSDPQTAYRSLPHALHSQRGLQKLPVGIPAKLRSRMTSCVVWATHLLDISCGGSRCLLVGFLGLDSKGRGIHGLWFRVAKHPSIILVLASAA